MMRQCQLFDFYEICSHKWRGCALRLWPLYSIRPLMVSSRPEASQTAASYLSNRANEGLGLLTVGSTTCPAVSPAYHKKQSPKPCLPLSVSSRVSLKFDINCYSKNLCLHSLSSTCNFCNQAPLSMHPQDPGARSAGSARCAKSQTI